MTSRDRLPDPLPDINCGLCTTMIKDPGTPGVASEYIEGDIRGLCRDCLDFIVSFSMTQSLEEAKILVRESKVTLRFKNLKDKLEAV